MPVFTRDTALHRIRLRHLQCFLAVAEQGTLRGAAQQLAISQPAVTKTLHELEELLGTRLFERGRQGAQPTAAARRFLRHAQASVAALAQAVDGVLHEQDEPPLRIGALPTVVPSVLPRAIAAWRTDWPQAGLQVVTGRNAELLARLRAHELDAVIGRLAEPQDMVDLSFELLYAEPLVIAVRAGHALLAHEAPTPAELSRHPLLLPAVGTVIRHGADSWLAAHGVQPQAGVTETLSTTLALALVLAGDALWFTPLSAVEPQLSAGTLRRLPLSTAGTEEPVGLLLPHDARLAPALAALVTAVRAEGAVRRG